MSTSKMGYLGKVSIGAGHVLGIGNWSMDGKSIAELDDTEFGDQSTKYALGIQDGGTISFAGLYKPDDTTGQDVLIQAFDERTELTDLRLYIDETSYFSPCSTSGYLSPTKTTGANTVLSNAVITAQPITLDKGALGTISFTARINGDMVLE
jgi:hypothetical protein